MIALNLPYSGHSKNVYGPWPTVAHDRPIWTSIYDGRNCRIERLSL